MAKTLIIHDRFQFRGGAERLVLNLAKILNADIATEFWTDTTYPKSEAPNKVFVLDSDEPRMMVLRYFRAQWNFWWKAGKLMKNYDTIIFSGNNCLAAAWRPLGAKKVVYYCHTPVRYVYDLFVERRAAEPSLLKRVVYYDIGKWIIRGCYRLGLSRMKTVVTNSQNVHDRLLRFCKKASRIIYPPINTKKFTWQAQGDYYLSFARLDSLKRVTDIVRAFQHMPNKKLVIASGGEDADRVAELARGYENIRLVGWVDDAQLKELVGSCIANIYIPIDEDFGMTAVEGMSAGKPCIGVEEGGLRETIIPDKTGVLIPAKYRIEDLLEAVKSMTPERALAMRNDCEQQAARFSLERFEREMKEVIAACHPEGGNKPTEGSSGEPERNLGDSLVDTDLPQNDTNPKIFRLAVDASRSIDGVQKTGVEVVSDALLKKLCHSEGVSKTTEGSSGDPSVGTSSLRATRLTFYTPREIPWLPKESQYVITRHRFWTIIGLSFAMLRDKPDALFVPVHTLPFFCPKKTVRAIHDVSFLRQPDVYSLRERIYMKFDLWRAKRVCSSVIVPTEAVKRDLVNLLGWPEEKIVVTGWGVPESRHPGEGRDLALPYSLTLDAGLVSGMTNQPFLLFIGRIEEKKNVANIIRAFGIFKETHPDWKFILAGKPGYGFEAIEPLLKNPGVHHLGYISHEKKTELFANAFMLAFVSREEGFAFPMLEAFQVKIPVLASSIPTLTEIAEDAALFAEPNDVRKIAENMSLIADNSAVRASLVAKGTEKLKKYSWESVTEKVLKTLIE